MKSEFKTAIILGIAIATAVGIMSIVFSTFDEEVQTSTIGETISKIDKSRFKMAPDLVGIAHYLNTTPEELEKEIEGKVVLYDIWTYSCINCIRTLPYITAWDDKYSDQGLLIVEFIHLNLNLKKIRTMYKCQLTNMESTIQL